jgi:16S rRNA (cytosine967-C5)-methyltransferase
MTRTADAGRQRIAPARVAAYEVLRAVNGGTADLPHALAQQRGHLADERDRALAGEIATGTLRWQAAFDHVVAQFTRRPVGRLDGEVLDVLRLSIFQLLHLDRVPASAVVNDAVDLARRAGKKSAAPLVNAVLRRVSRERLKLPLPPRPVDAGDREAQLEYLSIALSHPRWLAARWLDRHGFDDAESWLRFNNSPAALTLRVNTLKTTRAELVAALQAYGVETEPARFAPDGLVVRQGNPLLTPLSDQGVFFVQDEASQVVATFVEAAPGQRVLDACASPGGKTIAIAAAQQDRGVVVASDIRGRRLDLLARTVAASGATSIRVVQADAAALPFRTGFDWVLLDAPCSGLGTIRRDPEVRWRRGEADLRELAESQKRMLIETARVLRPGGRLVYATCSSEPEENEAVVAAVVSAAVVRPATAADLPPPVRALVNADGHLRTYPFSHGLEAFFAAVVVKP